MVVKTVIFHLGNYKSQPLQSPLKCFCAYSIYLSVCLNGLHMNSIVLLSSFHNFKIFFPTNSNVRMLDFITLYTMLPEILFCMAFPPKITWENLMQMTKIIKKGGFF